MQTVALTAMGPKKNSPKNANTIDSNQNTINVGDIVKVTDGQHKVKIWLTFMTFILN